MEKLFFKNFIKEEKDLNSLPRNSLLKVLKLTNSYLNKSIFDIIDEEIEKYENVNLITISNNRVNDIKSDFLKKKYIAIYNKDLYNVYVYDSYVDFYLSRSLTEITVPLKEILNEDIIKDFEVIHITSKLSKKISSFNFKENNNSDYKLGRVYEKILKIKINDDIKIRFYKNQEIAPLIEKKEKKKM